MCFWRSWVTRGVVGFWTAVYIRRTATWRFMRLCLCSYWCNFFLKWRHSICGIKKKKKRHESNLCAWWSNRLIRAETCSCLVRYGCNTCQTWHDRGNYRTWTVYATEVTLTQISRSHRQETVADIKCCISCYVLILSSSQFAWLLRTRSGLWL